MKINQSINQSINHENQSINQSIMKINHENQSINLEFNRESKRKRKRGCVESKGFIALRLGTRG